MAEFISTEMQGNIGTPEDIANDALFLASPQAAYVVGHNMVVDGGYLLR